MAGNEPKPIGLIGRTKNPGKGAVAPGTTEAGALDTASIMAEEFFKHFKKGAAVLGTEGLNMSVGEAGEMPTDNEKGLAVLLDVRDHLIETFQTVAGNKTLEGRMVETIRKVEEGISDMGGSVDPFNPAQHASGLESEATDILSNATLVAARTKRMYKLYSIATICTGMSKEKHPGIALTINGERDGKKFSVDGRVVAKTDFDGSEAIDYVKDDGNGFLGVKKFMLGKWTDVSSNYHTYWVLLAGQDDPSKK